MISVAAELAGLHPQTLRMYEARGLVRPARTPGGTRLYSESDVERLRLVQRLTTELGLNLAGVEHVLRLEDELRRLRARMRAARARAARRDSIRPTGSTGGRSCCTSQPQPPARGARRHGLQQADHQERRGRRGRAGARAARRQPRGHARPPDASRCSTRSCRGTLVERAGASPTRSAARRRRGSRSSRPSRAAARSRRRRPSFRRVLDKAVRRGAAARRRVRLGRAPAARARRRPARGAARGAPAGARRPARHVAGPRGLVPGAREVRPRPHRARRAGEARPGDRPRRGDPAHDPGALAPHEEQPGADRRAGRRQDRDRRGARAADRRGRRARGAEGQARLGARRRRARRRREVPRRVRGAAQGRPRRRSPRARARSSSSSTSSTRSSAPARPRAPSPRATC